MRSVNGTSEYVRDDGRDAYCRWGYICLKNGKLKDLVVQTGLKFHGGLTSIDVD